MYLSVGGISRDCGDAIGVLTERVYLDLSGWSGKVGRRGKVREECESVTKSTITNLPMRKTIKLSSCPEFK